MKRTSEKNVIFLKNTSENFAINKFITIFVV